MPYARLDVTSGVLAGKVYIVAPDDRITLGRGKSCDIRLKETPVSTRHCRLIGQGEGFLLSDADSRNGTRVNGQTIESAVLQHRDRIAIGESELVFRLYSSQSQAEAADPIDDGRKMQAPQLAHAPMATRFGLIALHHGFITAEQLTEALRESERSPQKRRLGEVLVGKGQMTRADIWEVLQIQSERRGSEKTEEEKREPSTTHTVIICFPAPIAQAVSRMCRYQDRRNRLDQLFAAIETSVQYLLCLALCDLFSCLAANPERSRLPDDPELDGLRERRPMRDLGDRVELLRHVAGRLAEQPDRFIKELPEVCGAGSELDRDVLDWLVDQQRLLRGGPPPELEHVHTIYAKAARRMTLFFQLLDWVCDYPLGFVRPNPLEDRTYLCQSCMGARIQQTKESYIFRSEVPFAHEVPFIAHRKAPRILLLWPWVQQRVAPRVKKRGLYLYREMPDPAWPCLTKVTLDATHTVDRWDLELSSGPSSNHQWLFAGLRSLPVVMDVPPELRLADALDQTRGSELIGRRFGDQRLLSILGTGGFSTIYLAVRPDGAQVALKVVSGRTASPTQYRRFEREYDRLVTISDHPGIIKVYQSGVEMIDDKKYPWYSMEFAAGGDLAGIIRDRTLETSGITWTNLARQLEIIDDFLSVAEAVAHLHQHGIIHRDIKPNNVLVMEDGSLRLSDFGLIKSIEPGEDNNASSANLTQIRTVIGTDLYMSPEQARGKELDETADVYALGILLAVLATGRRPLPVRNKKGSTLSDWDRLDPLPLPLKQFVLRCTEADSSKRPKDAQEVVLAFNTLITGGESDSGHERGNDTAEMEGLVPFDP